MTSSLTTKISAYLPSMTSLERSIADYFISQQLTEYDLATTQITQTLHISQATLTRFAKKCGFKGYREFVFEYLNSQKSDKKDFEIFHWDLTKRVMLDYHELIQQSHDLVDEEQLQAIAEMLEKADRVYFYGKGSSALVAQELKLRLMRLGLICDAISTTESMIWNTNSLTKNCLVIGFSLSGKTHSVLSSLEKAHDKGAQTVLITTANFEHKPSFTDVVRVASTHHLDYGNRISPQFPMLVMVDILYAYFLEINKAKKEQIFKGTIIKS
ncbi:MurR/RpiR family transcriptional regulator [Streptococcus sp. S784/96/1]|uniref:MurR/RpiR family transcriptional regulator n=1 Tax=Streptococcus sp. S784/96/1 TaxID=2653499 RepID=UPI001386BBE8|nr:MurR/RpiR family transcriptional regulator [Streptococcus sp. S784/96/1]